MRRNIDPSQEKGTKYEYFTFKINQANAHGQYPCVADIEVYCCYDYNAGLAFFDGISVVKDSNCVTSYSYNELGYLSGTHTSDGAGTDYTYSSNQVDVTGVQTDTNNYQSWYDNKHRVTAMRNSNGSTDYTVNYTYDSYGNVVETLTEELFDCMDAILTSATYSTNSSYFVPSTNHWESISECAENT